MYITISYLRSMWLVLYDISPSITIYSIIINIIYSTIFKYHRLHTSLCLGSNSIAYTHSSFIADNINFSELIFYYYYRKGQAFFASKVRKPSRPTSFATKFWEFFASIFIKIFIRKYKFLVYYVARFYDSIDVYNSK